LSRELQPGAVVEVSTPRGAAYVQVTHVHREFGPLVRVLPGLHEERPRDFDALAAGDARFIAFCPVDAGVSQGTMQVVANAEIPPSDQAFPLFKAAGGRDPVTGEVWNWWLWDGDNEWEADGSDDLDNLPTREVINQALLVERILSAETGA
jgi:hypothetical protein